MCNRLALCKTAEQSKWTNSWFPVKEMDIQRDASSLLDMNDMQGKIHSLSQGFLIATFAAFISSIIRQKMVDADG